VHASAFAFADGAAVAVAGDKGAGKTTTMLAALAAGATYITNDRMFVRTGQDGSEVWGWTDPVRIVAPGAGDKRTVTVRRYFDGDRSRVAARPLPVVAVVFPRVSDEVGGVNCEELGSVGLDRHILPPRARWLGIEADPGPRPQPVVPRFLRLSFPYRAATDAVVALRRALGTEGSVDG
jgi:hypothetical protein